MDERQLGLALALKEVGVCGDVSGFDSRLILQKTVYLLEEAGIRLGYSFNWYLRGPYSPALTRDLYGQESSNADVADWVLDPQSAVIANRIKPLVAGFANESASAKARRLELLASLHYLSRRRGADLNDPAAATTQLAQNGKHYSQDEVVAAIQTLRQVQLL